MSKLTENWFLVWFRRRSNPAADYVPVYLFVAENDEASAVERGRYIFCRDHQCHVSDVVHDRTERAPYGEPFVPGSGMLLAPYKSPQERLRPIKEILLTAMRPADRPQMILDRIEAVLSGKADGKKLRGELRREYINAANAYADHVGLPRPYPENAP